MFTLIKIIETAAGQLQTVVHGTYSRKADAEQIGDNLRLLYPWVKNVRVESADVAECGAAPLTRKKMAGSKLREAEVQRKIS